MRTFIVFACVMAVWACSEAQEEPLELREAPTLPRFETTLSNPSQLVLVEGSPITITQGASSVVLRGHVVDASSQFQTEGAAQVIGQADEEAFASRTVRVTIRARGINASGFRAAYSTNDNGNSGWVDLPLSSDFAEVSFDYQVPAIIRGADDFIGLLPPEEGAVEVQSIRVEIVS